VLGIDAAKVGLEGDVLDVDDLAHGRDEAHAAGRHAGDAAVGQQDVEAAGDRVAVHDRVAPVADQVELDGKGEALDAGGG
jgi:hypothetical protein